MNLLTEAQLYEIAGVRYRSGNRGRNQPKIVSETVRYINEYGHHFDLDNLLNLSRFLGQTAVESAYFSTTTEFASGKDYEGRSDLGNTQPGDGRRFKGRGLIQTTGRYNTTKFTKWAKAVLSRFVSKAIPDFVKNPKELANFPWAFFSAAYYWSEGNPTRRSLNRLAQQGNDEMITRRINGGLNHFSERLDATDRAALVLLGYKTDKGGIRAFQENAGITVDGLTGPETRNALISALKAANRPKPVSTPGPEKPAPQPAKEPAKQPQPAVRRNNPLAAIIEAILNLFRR